MSSLALVRWLLDRVKGRLEPLAGPASIRGWWDETRPALAAFSASIDQAVVSGFLADRVGFAFAGGLQAGLRALAPGLPEAPIVGLAVTEEGGGHPRAIRASLEPVDDGSTYRLNGVKRFTTLGVEADLLLVAASLGTDDAGRNRIRVARIEAGAPGVDRQPLPAFAVAPEISHAEVRFQDVAVVADALLPGDGYARYVKPFRTVEDTHVSAATLGHLIRVAAEHRWPRESLEALLAQVVQLRAIGLADPSALETHIALAGHLQVQERVLEALSPHWDLVSPAVRERWERDAGLRFIAGRARAKRAEVAWNTLTSSDFPPQA